jgi:hypothetical protein
MYREQLSDAQLERRLRRAYRKEQAVKRKAETRREVRT